MTSFLLYLWHNICIIYILYRAPATMSMTEWIQEMNKAEKSIQAK